MTGDRYELESALAYLTIGRALVEAASQLDGETRFKAWFTSQRFDFSEDVARDLMFAAEHENEIRDIVSKRITEWNPTLLAVAELRSRYEVARS